MIFAGGDVAVLKILVQYRLMSKYFYFFRFLKNLNLLQRRWRRTYSFHFLRPFSLSKRSKKGKSKLRKFKLWFIQCRWKINSTGCCQWREKCISSKVHVGWATWCNQRCSSWPRCCLPQIGGSCTMPSRNPASCPGTCPPWSSTVRSAPSAPWKRTPEGRACRCPAESQAPTGPAKSTDGTNRDSPCGAPAQYRAANYYDCTQKQTAFLVLYRVTWEGTLPVFATQFLIFGRYTLIMNECCPIHLWSRFWEIFF